jgi:hypothetical protein
MTGKKRREAEGSEGIPLSQAAKLLRLDQHEVKMRAALGYLEEHHGEAEGEEPHYSFGSVLKLQSQVLMQEIAGKLEPISPALVSLVEALAVVQYQRGALENNSTVLRAVRESA